ncbi:MAG TPA: hypothetical protein VG274_03940 [Rhizomicrobium sp.]|jgi:tetratricopeptide (TPR) repeat protein|nr:hypothetical protein [Rhizomicrobium sp.]
MAEELVRESEHSPRQRSDAVAWNILGEASREKADQFLDRQGALSQLQMENLQLENKRLNAQHAFEVSHLRFRRFSDYARAALEGAGFLVILLLVCGLGTMVWSATQDHDLVVDAFLVSPDVAQSGMTGSVLAGRVLDAFGRMQSSIGISVVQGAGSYHAGYSEEVRVEIPQTGISIGELNRYLREWLGHETHVTGDLVHAAKGYALTTRASGQPGVTIESADMDALVRKAAEHMFAVVRPLRYLDYLEANNRVREALAAVVPLTKAGDAHDRAVAYAAWAGLLSDSHDPDSALAKARMAASIDPQNPTAMGWLASIERTLGHDEAAWSLSSRNIGLWHGAEVADLDPGLVATAPAFFTYRRDASIGDWAAVLTAEADFADGSGYSTPANRAFEAAHDHDVALALSYVKSIPLRANSVKQNADIDEAQIEIAMMRGDWNAATAAARRAESILSSDPARLSLLRLIVWPRLALTLALSGRFTEAESIIAKTPPDCDFCLRMRGNIAAAKHDWAGAARMFSIVSARAPHIPFADTDWGAMLLRKGDFDGAIAKFESAHRKGPHFADPLEMWGEALMAKNRSDRALAKFEEANKYAPNWGRLHLKWGEALYYAGKHDEAKKQFALAFALDLSAPEKSELLKISRRT